MNNRKNILNTSQKGEVQVSLHWIFVIIIGAIILVFFISLVVQQKRISETNQLLELRKTVNSYIEGGRSVERGTIPISTFGSDLSFECQSIDDSCSCSLLFDEKVSLDTKSNVVFTSSSFKNTEELLLSTLPWDLPYKVTNFVYLINPDERFIFVYDSSDPLLKKKVEDIFNNELPDSIEKELISSNLRDPIIFDDTNFPKTKIVIFGRLPNDKIPLLPNFVMNENTFVVNIPFVISDNDRINFYSYDKLSDNFKLSQNSFYIGVSSLMGAIYSDNSQNYDCSMQSAFRNLNTVNKIQLERVKILSSSGYCSGAFYGSSHQEPFNTINSLSSNPSKWGDSDFPTLIRTVDDLKKLNNNIENQACPLLY